MLTRRLRMGSRRRAAAAFPAPQRPGYPLSPRSRVAGGRRTHGWGRPMVLPRWILSLAGLTVRMGGCCAQNCDPNDAG
eukprot:COSAG05_NODE_19833_length_287_cov_0.808511_1_plen_77_part_10